MVGRAFVGCVRFSSSGGCSLVLLNEVTISLGPISCCYPLGRDAAFGECLNNSPTGVTMKLTELNGGYKFFTHISSSRLNAFMASFFRGRKVSASEIGEYRGNRGVNLAFARVGSRARDSVIVCHGSTTSLGLRISSVSRRCVGRNGTVLVSNATLYRDPSERTTLGTIVFTGEGYVPVVFSVSCHTCG